MVRSGMIQCDKCGALADTEDAAKVAGWKVDGVAAPPVHLCPTCLERSTRE